MRRAELLAGAPPERPEKIVTPIFSAPPDGIEASARILALAWRLKDRAAVELGLRWLARAVYLADTAAAQHDPPESSPGDRAHLS